MPDGSAIVKYTGKRGTTWRIKFRDASGKQMMETLGKASEGWTKRKAEAALRARLTDVERDAYRRPEPSTFATFATSWLNTYPDAKGLKRSTRRSYMGIVEKHLMPEFGRLKLVDVDVERIDSFLAKKRRAGLAPATLNRALNVLSLILGAAVKRGLVRVNVVSLVDRPKEQRRRWRILTPAETVAVERAFDALVAEADNDRDRDDREVARLQFLTHMATGIRAGEALGLHWRNVRLADPEGPALRIDETWVRSGSDTPKSRAGHRTLALGSRLASEMFDHRARSAFSGDDDRVFANPRTGRPFDASRYGEILRLALDRVGIRERIRPSHDLRHSSITNAAAAGTSPAALMARAGHSSMSTTLLYIDLAGESFRDEADLLERRLWGEPVESSGRNSASAASEHEAAEAVNGLN